MNRFARLVSATLLLSVFLFSQTGIDLRRQFVGRTSCSSELDRDAFSIRLDRTQNAFLLTSTLHGRPVAAIVQSSSPNNHCGIVRDIIESSASETYFEPECVAPKAPHDVTVAVRNKSDSAKKGYSQQAWSVDLKQLRFVTVLDNVRCFPESYAGNDEGDDLSIWARRRRADLK